MARAGKGMGQGTKEGHQYIDKGERKKLERRDIASQIPGKESAPRERPVPS